MTDLSPDELDQADMARLAGGQEAALNDLIDRHGERLFRYLVRSLQDEDTAADLAQETFARVYLHRTRFDRQRKFSTWLYAIASNLVRDHYRWRARHPEVSLDATDADHGAPGADEMPAASPTPGDVLLAGERVEAVRKAVGALPEELRTPLILAEYEELPQAEIASALGCSAKAVETRIYRARKRLREALKDWLRV